jgi:hypothetical protein
MDVDTFRRGRIEKCQKELQRAVEVAIAEFECWERNDVPPDLSPVPFMVAYGLLSHLAADLAGAHDPIGHEIVSLSDQLTAAVRPVAFLSKRLKRDVDDVMFRERSDVGARRGRCHVQGAIRRWSDTMKESRRLLREYDQLAERRAQLAIERLELMRSIVIAGTAFVDQVEDGPQCARG